MGHLRCPKCGYAEAFDDECPRCGVYVSKYLAALERRASAGPWQGAASPQAPVPSGPEPSSMPSAGARPAEASSAVSAILWWVLGLLLLAGVGYVVLVDWFGAGYAYDAPAGWQKADDEATEQAVQGMCPRVRAKTTVHALYTLRGDLTGRSAIGILELDDRLPMDDTTLQQLRGNADRAQGQMQGLKVVRAERARYGGRPAVEVQIDLDVAGTKISLLQLMLAAERSTMLFVLIAPGDVFRRQIDAVHESLATLRLLPSGLRGKPWFKHSLRWLWVLAVAGTVLFGLSRLHRG